MNALDRLESVDPPDEAIFPANGAKTWFAYDGAGNRTDFGPQSSPGMFISPHTTYAYDPEKRLTGIELDGNLAESFDYDANGHAVSWTPPGASARTLGYDALGRLVSISGGFSASYAYDPFGRRIQKTEQGVTTRYQYDGLDVVAEYSETQLTATYVFGPGIDEVLKLERGTAVAAYHTDGLGSVVAVSVDGTLRNTYRYDAFGKAVSQGGSSPLPNAYTYTGRELDGSGLYYYRARYYLPSAGRFLTPDPIGLQGGINAYAYVGSNPVNYTDPFGLTAGRAVAPAAPTLSQRGGTGIGATWAETTSVIAGGVSTYGSVGEYSNVVNGQWRGANAKWYSLDWGGNQWTGGRTAVETTAKSFRALSKGFFLMGAGVSFYEGGAAALDGDIGGVAKAGVDVFFGYLGIVGPWGAAVSGAYWAIDLTIGWDWIPRAQPTASPVPLWDGSSP